MYKYFAEMKNLLKCFTIVVACLLLMIACTPEDEYIAISGFAQGGTYTVKLNLNGVDGRVDASPEEIRDSVDAILGRIDKSLSGYNKGSLLSRINSGESIVPDDLFIEMYSRSYEIFEDTEGAVDVASAPLFDIWGFGFSKDSMPSEEEVRSVMSASGSGRLVPDVKAVLAPDGTLAPESLLKDGDGTLPKLNFNAVAQGYSCDVVAGYLYSIGVKDMLVDIGEFFCDGRNPSGKPWTIGIDRPVDGNDMVGADIQGVFRAPEGPHGIVTSGNYRKFYVRDGKKYAHTLDPRTGYPVQHSLLSATVVAADALTADAYATWCMVVGFDEAKAFLENTDGFEGCLIYDDAGTMKTWCSPGFYLEEL